jgi:6-phosphofructokinase 1
VHGELGPLTSRSVSHIIGRGGTFLGSSRFEAFRSDRGKREAVRTVNEAGLDALVVIGGDGTMRGARALHEARCPTVGVPATIENDVAGTDVSIGVDTALNTALDALDRIKDTASSHEQAFLVELVGRTCGYLTLMAGIAGGAEMVCIPEIPYTLQDVAAEVADAYVRGKQHCIIVVAAGAEPHALEIAEHLRARAAETGFEVRLAVLGHIQRGGAPTARDRMLATRFGAEAVDALHDGDAGVMVGSLDGVMARTPLEQVTERTRSLDRSFYELAEVLAR